MTKRQYKKHGKTTDPVYKIWQNIKNRCTNKNDPYFRNYGGRGVSISANWLNDFAAFYAEIGPRPTSAHTVERKDNDKGYEPGNVRWATRKEQAQNMRKNVNLTFNGKTQTMALWASDLGLVPSTIWYRVFVAKMPVDLALSTPRRNGRRPSHESRAEI